MLVGNDVVDLRDSESQPEALHSRFDARVFTAAEREALGVSAAPYVLRWTLWAAKESAYKIAKKLDPTVRFLWREFSTHPMGEGWLVVVHGPHSFDVRVSRTDEWVHSVATHSSARHCSSTHGSARHGSARQDWAPLRSDGSSVGAGVERLTRSDADPSSAVRKFARAAVGSRVECPPSQIWIAAERGIPVAFWRERRLSVDLSLSHHGRFVAWAYGDCVIPDDRRGFAAA